MIYRSFFSLEMAIFFLSTLDTSNTGPENAYSVKKDNKTRGGSKDIKDSTNTIKNKLTWGTFCLIEISLKL